MNKSAREMFEELGYEKEQKIEIDRIGHKHICFRNKNNKSTTIHFDIDTKELEKFGFQYDVLDDTYNRSVERKTDEVCIVISQYDRSICLMCIQDYGMDGDEYFRYDVDEYVQDLIKANLVEKVEDK